MDALQDAVLAVGERRVQDCEAVRLESEDARREVEQCAPDITAFRADSDGPVGEAAHTCSEPAGSGMGGVTVTWRAARGVLRLRSA